jgi:hypothetical protein
MSSPPRTGGFALQKHPPQLCDRRFDGSEPVNFGNATGSCDFRIHQLPPNEASIETLEKRLNPKY